MERKNPTIDDWIAAKPISDAPAERLAIAFPTERPTKEFGSLVVTLIGAIDLGSDRELVGPRRCEVELDDAPVLDPRIRVDPQISLVAGEMAAQERSR